MELAAPMLAGLPKLPPLPEPKPDYIGEYRNVARRWDGEGC